jgi:16S rRNA (guanine527-N7)-methyltransferase
MFYLNDDIKEKLIIYEKEVIQWTNFLNLVSNKDKNEIWQRHIVDSIQAAFYIYNNKFHKILDVGAGAGFPGIILAILFQEKKIVLCEKSKRCFFLRHIKRLLNLDNLIILESDIRKVKISEYDLIISRAFRNKFKINSFLNMPSVRQKIFLYLGYADSNTCYLYKNLLLSDSNVYLADFGLDNEFYKNMVNC